MTGTRVFLRGRGSGHVELGQREEHLEPLHLLIVPDKGAASRDAVNVTEAVRLCEDLLATVKADLLDSQQRSPTMVQTRRVGFQSIAMKLIHCVFLSLLPPPSHTHCIVILLLCDEWALLWCPQWDDVRYTSGNS